MRGPYSPRNKYVIRASARKMGFPWARADIRASRAQAASLNTVMPRAGRRRGIQYSQSLNEASAVACTGSPAFAGDDKVFVGIQRWDHAHPFIAANPKVNRAKRNDHEREARVHPASPDLTVAVKRWHYNASTVLHYQYADQW